MVSPPVAQIRTLGLYYFTPLDVILLFFNVPILRGRLFTCGGL